MRWMTPIGVALGGLALACAPTPAPPPAQAPPVAPAAPAAPVAPAVQAVPGTSKDVWYVNPWSLGWEEPKNKGGTFTYAVNSSPPQLLSPWGRNLQSRVFADNTYDGLLGRRLQPGKSGLAADVFCRLCESWEMKADQKTWVFKLRQNVKFHDGGDFTGEDVKFSLDKVMTAETGSEFRSLLATTIAEVKVPEKYIVEVITKEPDSDLANKLGFGGITIVSKTAFDSGVDLTKTIVGTGPFKMERFEKDVEFVAVRNPTFWGGPDRPYIDRLVGKFVGDKSTRAAGFVSKQLDISTTFDAKEMEPIAKAVPSAKVVNYGGILASNWTVNINKKPFDDVRVRKAMNLAIDRDEIGLAVTAGLGKRYTGHVLPYDWLAAAFTEAELAKFPGWAKPKDQEIAEAKRLLAEAGYPNGFTAKATADRTSTSNAPMNEAASSQMTKIGVDITLDHTDTAVFNTNESTCNGDLFLSTRAGSNSVVSGQLLRMVTGSAQNFCKYSNPEFDKLFQEMNRTFDEKKRWELVKKATQILMDDMPSIPLMEAAQHSIQHPWVHNWYNQGHSWGFPWYPATELLWVDKH